MLTKKFELISIEEIPLPEKEVAGINEPKVDYETSIGGSNAPELGADKTSEHTSAGFTGQGDLATKDNVSAAEILDRAITSTKIALDAIQGDVIKAGAITENKLYTGAVTSDKIDSNAVTAAKIASRTITAAEIASGTITSNEITVSSLSALSANIGTVTSGTITGALLQTTSDPNAGVKISSFYNGISIYGQSLTLYDTSYPTPQKYGVIGGFGGYYNIETYNNRNMLLDAGSATVHFKSNAAPLADGGNNLGYYNYRWGNCFALNLTFENGYFLNKSGSALALNGLNRLAMDGGTFRRVGFSFKDTSGVNRYIEVLATGDPT